MILKGEWTPAVQDTMGALSAAIVLVQKTAVQSKLTTDVHQMENAQKILKQDYAVQFRGKILNGKKVIECNFFPVEKIDEFKYWEKSPVMVCDGGYRFWHVDYDLETGTCGKLWINGVG